VIELAVEDGASLCKGHADRNPSVLKHLVIVVVGPVKVSVVRENVEYACWRQELA